MEDRKTILVVDDEVDLIEVLKLRLKQEGYNVLTAHDGKEGLALVNNEDIDLVLLDIMLPKVGGIELYKYISKTKPALPVVVLTGRDKLESFFKDVKAAGFISKPFELEDLFRTIKRVLAPEISPLILLIDRKVNPLIEKTKASFMKIGFRVEVIESLHEFQKVTSANIPKHIIMEYMQQDMQFEDFVKGMREILPSKSEKVQPPLSQPPILVYSHSSTELSSIDKSYYKKKCLAAGADEYIGNPKDEKAVVFGLREYLLKKETEREEKENA